MNPYIRSINMRMAMTRRSMQDKTCKDDKLPTFVSEAIDEIGGLSKLARTIPDENAIRDQVKVCRALSNETRLTILWSISCCDMCPCVLKEYLKVGDSTISYHLDILEETGLISGRPEKNWRIYTITEKGRTALKGWTGPASGEHESKRTSKCCH